MKKIILALLLCGIATDSYGNGFTRTQGPLLESEIQKKYPPHFLAQKLTESNVSEQWQNDSDADLALYVAIKWLEQNNVVASSELLNRFEATQTFKDLWNYYRAQSYLSLNETEKASPYVSDLENKLSHDEDVVILKSSFLVYADQLTHAIELVNHYIKTNKKSGYVYFQRAYLHMLALSHILALADFKKAAYTLPRDDIRLRQQSCFQIGLIYLKFFLNEKKADRWFAKGMTLDPNSALAQQVGLQIKR